MICMAESKYTYVMFKSRDLANLGLRSVIAYGMEANCLYDQSSVQMVLMLDDLTQEMVSEYRRRIYLLHHKH